MGILELIYQSRQDEQRLAQLEADRKAYLELEQRMRPTSAQGILSQQEAFGPAPGLLEIGSRDLARPPESAPYANSYSPQQLMNAEAQRAYRPEFFAQSAVYPQFSAGINNLGSQQAAMQRQIQGQGYETNNMSLAQRSNLALNERQFANQQEQQAWSRNMAGQGGGGKAAPQYDSAEESQRAYMNKRFGTPERNTEWTIDANGQPMLQPLRGSEAWRDASSKVDQLTRAAGKAGEIAQNIDQYGTVDMFNPGRQADMSQKRASVLSAIAVADNLGVLQEGERRMLEEQLPDPKDNIFFTRNDRVSAAYRGVQKRLNDAINDARRRAPNLQNNIPPPPK